VNHKHLHSRKFTKDLIRFKSGAALKAVLGVLASTGCSCLFSGAASKDARIQCLDTVAP